MGMYTALSLGVELNIPKGHPVARILSYMVQGDEIASDEIPLHPLFNTPRWPILLRCDSYYFDYDTTWTLRWDDISQSYFLSGVSNLKNYDNEIRLFLDWLNKYIHPSSTGFLGWTMYEEQDLPTLITRVGTELFFIPVPKREQYHGNE